MAVLVALAAACAGRVPLPEHLRVASAAELRARMEAARSPLGSYSAEARLTYFGKEGRAKGSATLAVQRPASLRYELHGPHGGVIEAFATNGVELQLLDLRNERFVYGPATRANLDRLLSFAPLGLEAESWVALLFGDVLPPAEAELGYDEREGRFVLRWRAADLDHELHVDPASARATRAVVRRGGTSISDVTVEDRDEHGLPTSLRLRAPQAEVDLEVRLRDVTPDPELDASVFVLEPPRNLPAVHLDAGKS